MDGPTSGRVALVRRHPVWIGAILLVLVLWLVLVLAQWNWAKGPVQRIMTDVTGRDFRIDGRLDVDLFPLEVSAEGIHLGNAPWASQPVMVSISRAHMRLRFWPLLLGRVTLPLLRVEQPDVRLERNADGKGNWQFWDPPQCQRAGCASRVRILQLIAQDGRLRFDEPALQTAIDLRFESRPPSRADALAPLGIRGAGSYRAAPFDLEGQIDSPLALRGHAVPYRVDVAARAGGTRARINGALAEPLQLEHVAVNLELRGADLADLYQFTGIVLPVTPSYELRGKLSRIGNRYSYEDFKGTVGDSDLTGDAHLDVGGDRPRLIAKLSSRVIDFDDLAGFVGGTPRTGKGEAASKTQERAANAQAATGRLLPATPIRLERLRAMNADVQLRADRVNSRRLPLETMEAHLLLEDGQLRVAPLNFRAAGGALASEVRVDARQDAARFEMKMRMQQLQLPLLLPRVKQMQDALGNLNGGLELRGFGNSAAAVLGSAEGEFAVIMGRGSVSNLLLEIAGLDVAESLAFLIGKDQNVTLECAYADIGLVDGVATTRSMAFDTTDTALLVRGGMSFRDESLDFTLLQRPKDVSPISIRTPIRITGTFADPQISLKGGPLLLRGAAVAGLAAIAPPLALLALIEPGTGKDVGCSRGGANENREPPQPKDRTPASVGPRPAPGLEEKAVPTPGVESHSPDSRVGPR